MKKNRTYKMEAIVVDMDGVITQTAKTHKEAWKKMFTAFLEQQQEQYGPVTDEDYVRYIDGKPRYEGVRSFLASRNIELPYGNPDDQSGKKTVCGLGNRKNKYFLELLERKGVDTYDEAIKKIKEWRSRNLKTAVVSSSKNCKHVLEIAGITDLFDVRVDGVTLQEQKMKGKPAPDMFLEAARQLGTHARNCILIEDAISGVQAGTRGNFALVVGVDRTGKEKFLYENGADIVVKGLDQLILFQNPDIETFFSQYAPPVFTHLASFKKDIGDKKPVLFLDYDGTLTPIVRQPEDAIISDEMKHILNLYATKNPLAVISGRDMDDVRNMVGLDNLIYAGSHGFRITGPGGLYLEHEKSEEILPKLDEIEEELNATLTFQVEGIRIERKRYAVAVHYRNVKGEEIPTVIRKVDEIVRHHSGFKKGAGKKIVEIKPDTNWHKGKAVNWILDRLNLANRKDIIPVYIGDDVTDEDAFESLSGKGIGILVGFHGGTTIARYTLKNVYQVRLFIEMLMNTISSS